MSESGKNHQKFVNISFWRFFFYFLVQVETTKTQNPLEYNSTFAEESLTFTNPLEDIEDYEEDEEVVPSPVLDPDLEAKVEKAKNSSKLNIWRFFFNFLGSSSLRTHQRERSHLCQRAFFGLFPAIGTRTQGLAAYRWKQTTSQIYSTAIIGRLSGCRPRASVSTQKHSKKSHLTNSASEAS